MPVLAVVGEDQVGQERADVEGHGAVEGKLGVDHLYEDNLI